MKWMTRRGLAIGAAVILVAGCGGGTAATTTTVATTTTLPPTTTTTEPPVNLREIVCVVNSRCTGDETYASITISSPENMVEVVKLMIDELGFSGSLAARIGNTRALDGTLTADSPDGFTASWSYHPDTGLSLIVEKTTP